jgi:holo-[acyl-carrier protein] synthase
MSVIGIGVDVVDIERFGRSLARTPSMRTRLFVDEELDYVAPKVDPVPSLAARFAAREAAMKAVGVGLGAFGFHDVWVRILDNGAPSLVVQGRGAQIAKEHGVNTWHLSLSHDGAAAVAMVVASR